MRVARLIPLDLSLARAGVRIQQELAGVAPHALLGRIRSIDAISVPLSRPDVGQIGVPGECIDLVEWHLAFVSLIVEETQLDSLRHLGQERKVRPGAVEAGPERIRAAGPNLQVRHLRPSLAEGLAELIRV